MIGSSFNIPRQRLHSNLNKHFTSEDVPCWISLEEAAIIFHISLQALYSGIYDTTLPYERHGSRVVVRAHDVEHFKAVHV